ncbi:hypothetical protein SNE40_014312 [Patella caerulea]|uniref:Myb/SANT-like DNA-binding domain-containing protein n=1 Tax=Patella caerulea TaxID=87958 RepID=A0AAN8JHR9_PATCE
MASDKRERQPNWAPREEILFVTAYIERADIIDGEFSGCGVGSSRGISHATKEEAWDALREIVNSNSANLRTIEQFKKKIAQIKCLALRKNRKNHTETGGGKGFIITDAEQLYLDFLKNRNSTTLSGINTGTDIGFSTESE